MRSVWSAAGTCGAGGACVARSVWDHRHRMPRPPAARASPRVWNRAMTTVSPASAPPRHRRDRHRRRRAPSTRRRRGRRPPRRARRDRRRRDGARRRIPHPRRGASPSDPEPHYGISTGFGALATTFIAEDRRAQLQASLIRSHAAGTGAEVETEVVRALQLLRLQTLATGHTGVRPVVVETYAGDAQRRDHARSCGSTGRSAARAISRRSRTSRSRRWGSRTCGWSAVRRPRPAAADALGRRRSPRAARAPREGGPRPHQRHRRHARDAAARAARPLDAARHGRCGRRDVDREPARHRRGLRRGPDGAPAAGRAGGIRGQPARLPRRTRRSSPATAIRPSAPASRTPTRCAARPRCTAPPATPWTTPAPSRRASSRAPSTTRSSPTTAASSPTATSTGRRSPTCSTSSRSRWRTSPRSPSAAPIGRSTGPAATACRRSSPTRSGVDSGLMIAQYAAAGIVSELKRLAVPASVDSIPSSAMQEDHVSMGWAAARKLRRGIDGLARVLAIEVLTGARAIDLRAPLQPGAATGAVRDLVRTVAARTGSRPFPLTRHRGGDRARALRADRGHRGRSSPMTTDAATGSASSARPAHDPRRARQRAHREELGRRGGQAHADEQPRPRGRRAPRRPRRLRRHGQGRPQLGGVRRDRPHPRRAGARRDAARAVRQARRRVPHARVGAARADRQLEPRGGLGDVAGVPPPRAARADDVRADDGRVVDLHRHPGHPAGHVRDLRGGRALARPRRPGGNAHADRRMRRHGRRAAARRHPQRRGGADRRRRRVAPRPPRRARLPRRVHDRPRRRRRSGGRRQGRGPRR